MTLHEGVPVSVPFSVRCPIILEHITIVESSGTKKAGTYYEDISEHDIPVYIPEVDAPIKEFFKILEAKKIEALSQFYINTEKKPTEEEVAIIYKTVVDKWGGAKTVNKIIANNTRDFGTFSLPHMFLHRGAENILHRSDTHVRYTNPRGVQKFKTEFILEDLEDLLDLIHHITYEGR